MTTHNWWDLKKSGGLSILGIVVAAPIIAVLVTLAGAGVLALG